jgi:hypothetical protein
MVVDSGAGDESYAMWGAGLPVSGCSARANGNNKSRKLVSGVVPHFVKLGTCGCVGCQSGT